MAALIVAVVEAATPAVWISNVAVVFPEWNSSIGSTNAAALSLDRLTIKPPDGAALESVTVPVDLAPPPTLVGFNAIENVVGGRMLSEACPDDPPKDALT